MHLQQRRLAAAGRADEADELAGVDGEGEVPDRLDRARCVLVDLLQAADVEHGLASHSPLSVVSACHV